MVAVQMHRMDGPVSFTIVTSTRSPAWTTKTGDIWEHSAVDRPVPTGPTVEERGLAG